MFKLCLPVEYMLILLPFLRNKVDLFCYPALNNNSYIVLRSPVRTVARYFVRSFTIIIKLFQT